MRCPSCCGDGNVYSRVGVDEDNYPLYRKARCPYCMGTGDVDLSELFLVPRGMVKDEFFVSPEFGGESQRRLRMALEQERKFMENRSPGLDIGEEK